MTLRERIEAISDERDALRDEVEALRALLETAGIHPLAVRLAVASGVDPAVALKGAA